MSAPNAIAVPQLRQVFRVLWNFIAHIPYFFVRSGAFSYSHQDRNGFTHTKQYDIGWD